MNKPEGRSEEDFSKYMPSEGTNETTPQSEPESAPTTGSGYGFERQNPDLIWIASKVNNVRLELSRYVIGQHEMVELMMAGIFSNGHLLLEGAP